MSLTPAELTARRQALMRRLLWPIVFDVVLSMGAVTLAYKSGNPLWVIPAVIIAPVPLALAVLGWVREVRGDAARAPNTDIVQ